jgi:hypothetical protein
LTEIIKDVRDHGYNIDWKQWCKDAVEAGWEYDRCKSSALDALREVAPERDFRQEFLLTFLLALGEELGSFYPDWNENIKQDAAPDAGIRFVRRLLCDT